MGWFERQRKFKCPVKVVKANGQVKTCGMKFLTLEQLLKHADRSHGGRGREL